jgi:hypothetical protein
MLSRRTRATAQRVAPPQRRAPDALVFGRSIRLAATMRPAMTRATVAGFLRCGASLHPSHDIQLSRLATTIAIPVMSTAKQENSRRSLRSIDILPPPLISCVVGHLDTPRYPDTSSIVLGLLSESRTITDYLMPASLALSHVLLDLHE